jgi:TPR repeat protein
MESTRLLRRRAEKGDADAVFRLGYRIAFGRNRPRPTDWAAAIRLWKQAATGGHERAEFYIGTCYDQGYGVARNVQRALRWYEKAAGHGHLTAMFNLAFSYREGDGVPRDYQRMLHWFTKAAELGDPDS